MTSWRKLIEIALNNNKESWDDVISICPEKQEWLDYLFDDDYGSIEGNSFTLWTKKSVYFPVCYDGSEWVGKVSRNPDGKATNHMGG
jgi:hypothetical protein